MMNTWIEHCNLIATYCNVRIRTATAIWYYENDGSYGICELRNGEMYSCNSRKEFDSIMEMEEA